jgi:hypothetical protein
VLNDILNQQAKGDGTDANGTDAASPSGAKPNDQPLPTPSS